MDNYEEIVGDYKDLIEFFREYEYQITKDKLENEIKCNTIHAWCRKHEIPIELRIIIYGYFKNLMLTGMYRTGPWS